MKILKVTLLIFALCVFLNATGRDGATAERPADIKVGVPADVLEDYIVFLGDRDPLKITDYSGYKSRRDVVELVLFQQALALGGETARVIFVAGPTYERIVDEIRGGHLTGSGTSVWDSDLEKTKNLFFITDPIIENGQFEAGLYTALSNAKARSADTLEKVRELTAVSNRNWTPDWLTLNAFDLKAVRHIQNWKLMVRNVATQRSDFLLAPFQQTEGMLLQVDDMTLAPIPGLKVGLIGCRHFAISKKYPNSDRIFAALQQGVRLMKKQGTFDKAYTHSGFYNLETKDWLQLNDAFSCPRCNAETSSSCTTPHNH